MIPALIVRIWSSPSLRRASITFVTLSVIGSLCLLTIRQHNDAIRDRTYREALQAESRRHVQLLTANAERAASDLSKSRSSAARVVVRYVERRDSALSAPVSPEVREALATADTAIAAADTASADCDSVILAKNAIIVELLRRGASFDEPQDTWRSRLSIFAEANYEVIAGISGVRGGVALDLDTWRMSKGLSVEIFAVREEAEQRPRIGVGVRKRL